MYTRDEVQAVVELYTELITVPPARRLKPFLETRIIDLQLAFKRLPPTIKAAVLACGVVGLTTRETSRALGVSHDTAWRRYEHGLDLLTDILNNGRR